jgi:hypothetical protein
MALGLRSDVATRRQVVSIPLEFNARGIDLKGSFPATFAVPCCRGALRDLGGAVLSGSSFDCVPVQVEPIVYWPDGSVQWLICDYWIVLYDHASLMLLRVTTGPATSVYRRDSFHSGNESNWPRHSNRLDAHVRAPVKPGPLDAVPAK